MKRTIKNIHLWLSVPFGILIAMICLGGAALVFEKEITNACRHSVFNVDSEGKQPLSIAELMEKVGQTLPDSVSVTGVTVFPSPTKAYQVSLSKPRRASVYVNQYTGEITGAGDRMRFFESMTRMHRWLFGQARTADGGMGFGKLVVGISTIILIFIVITGVWIWLLRSRKGIIKGLKISVTQGWSRFWHDLHVAGGVYTTLFLLLFALTGLTWSFSWYRTGYYKTFGAELQANAQHGGAHHGTPIQPQEQLHQSPQGSLERVQDNRPEGVRGGRPEGGNPEGVRGGRPAGGSPEGVRGGRSEGGRPDGVRGSRSEGGHPGGVRGGRPEGGNPEGVDERQDNHGEVWQRPGSSQHSPYGRWQKVYDQLSEANPGFVQIAISDGSATVVPKGSTSTRNGDRYEYDRRGQITAIPASAPTREGSIRGWTYKLHTGSLGGIWTRIIWFIAAFIGFTLPLTGYYIWIRRLVRKKKGLPQQHHYQ